MAFVIIKFVEGNSSEHGSRVYSAGINSCCGF
jgi:hypothetical protein